jgi:hypothetical protein
MKQSLESLKGELTLLKACDRCLEPRSATTRYHEYGQTQPVKRTIGTIFERTIGTIFERNFAPSKPTQMR